MAGPADPGPATTPAPAAAGDARTLAVPPASGWVPWESPVVRTWLPRIPGAGPGEPPASGFARTPQGALAAAATLHPLAYYQWPQAAWTEFADTRVQWAPGQREQLAEALVPVWAAEVPDPMRVTPVGYRVIVYDPDRARFRLWWDVDFPDGRSATVGALVDVVWAARRLAAVLRRAGDGHARVAAHRHLPGLGPAMTPLLASALDLCGIPGLGAGACAAADALTSPEAVVGGLVAGPAGVIGGAASAMGLTMLGQIADSFFNAWWLFQAKALTFWTDTPTPGPGDLLAPAAARRWVAWLAQFVLIISILLAAGRTILTRDARNLADAGRAVVVTILTSALVVTVAAALVAAGDAIASALLDGALAEGFGADPAPFAAALLSSGAGPPGMLLLACVGFLTSHRAVLHPAGPQRGPAGGDRAAAAGGRGRRRAGRAGLVRTPGGLVAGPGVLQAGRGPDLRDRPDPGPHRRLAGEGPDRPGRHGRGDHHAPRADQAVLPVTCWWWRRRRRVRHRPGRQRGGQQSLGKGMSMSVDTQPTPATQARYSGWHKVTSPGIGPLGLAGTIAGISGLVLAFLVGSLGAPVAGLVLAVLTVAGLLPLVVRARDGRTGYGWAGARIGFGWARARGRSRYTPAMLGGRVAMGWSGPSPAPGLLARSQLRGVIVPLWDEVGVLRTRANRWTVCLECPVDSAALVDPDTLAGWTEAWGHWLASLPARGAGPGRHRHHRVVPRHRPAPDRRDGSAVPSRGTRTWPGRSSTRSRTPGPGRPTPPGCGWPWCSPPPAPGTARPHRRRCVT